MKHHDRLLTGGTMHIFSSVHGSTAHHCTVCSWDVASAPGFLVGAAQVVNTFVAHHTGVFPQIGLGGEAEAVIRVDGLKRLVIIIARITRGASATAFQMSGC